MCIQHTVMKLSCGSVTSLPTLQKLQDSIPSTKYPLEKKKTKGCVRRPSSAGAPPMLHMLQQAEKIVAVDDSKRIKPGSNEWEYCSLPVAAEMAEGLAGE